MTVLEIAATLNDIERLDKDLEQHFRDKFLVQSSLTRQLVSFQANKARPVYRWYKYKEAFSAALVEYLFEAYGVAKGRILDPFAGSGTALFAASTLGLDSDGIELLPIGQQIVNAKKILETSFRASDFDTLRNWAEARVWEKSVERIPLSELRITRGAYPEQTKESIEKYLGSCMKENSQVQTVAKTGRTGKGKGRRCPVKWLWWTTAGANRSSAGTVPQYLHVPASCLFRRQEHPR